VGDLLCDVINMSDPQSSNRPMRHMINDVSAPVGVSLKDLMVILDSVFIFGQHCINLS